MDRNWPIKWLFLISISKRTKRKQFFCTHSLMQIFKKIRGSLKLLQWLRSFKKQVSRQFSHSNGDRGVQNKWNSFELYILQRPSVSTYCSIYSNGEGKIERSIKISFVYQFLSKKMIGRQYVTKLDNTRVIYH